MKDGVSISSAYRVEKRQVLKDGVALDAGYMRQAMKREGMAEQVRYARFLVTMKRDKSGAWKILADAAMPSTAEVWNALTPQAGLTFDPQAYPPPAPRWKLSTRSRRPIASRPPARRRSA